MKLKTLSFNALRGQNLAMIQTDKGRDGPVVTVAVPAKRAMTRADLKNLLAQAAAAVEADDGA